MQGFAVHELHLVGWYGMPAAAFLALIAVVVLEGRPRSTNQKEFARRLRRSGRWRQLNPLVLPVVVFVLALCVEHWANPRQWMAYFTALQWLAGVMCLVGAPASVWLYTGFVPKLERRGKLVVLERVGRETTSFHVRKASNVLVAMRQSNLVPMKNASLAVWFLVGYGEALVSAGWRRIELVSPEIDEHALDRVGIEFMVAEHLPAWRVACVVDRPFPRWRALLYWATKRPRRWAERERGVVLEYMGTSLTNRALKSHRDDRRAARRARSALKATA